MSRRRITREQVQEIGEREIRVLRILCEYDGVTETARAIGVDRVSLLFVMAGLGHRSRPSVLQRFRRFFADFDDLQGETSQ